MSFFRKITNPVYHAYSMTEAVQNMLQLLQQQAKNDRKMGSLAR